MPEQMSHEELIERARVAAENADTLRAGLNQLEEWRDVVGYEGFYQVSSHGRVRRVERMIRQESSTGKVYERVWRGGIIKQTDNCRGYLSVMLSMKGRQQRVTAHILVAHAFLPPPPGPIGNRRGEYQINHKDGDKHNNLLHNLEWSTPQENITHAAETGLMAHAKLDTKKVRTIKRQLAAGRMVRKVARDFGVAECTISNIKSGYRWSHVEVGDE